MGNGNTGLNELESNLVSLFGVESGKKRLAYIEQKLGTAVETLREQSARPPAVPPAIPPADPYKRLDGSVFAICYPDNIHDGAEPTLKTLERVLQTYFPSIGGIHILPERTMSHDDLWPQDLLSFQTSDQAQETVHFLKSEHILDENLKLTSEYQQRRSALSRQVDTDVIAKLDEIHSSHFNDGGFSQKTRKTVDPRFGTVDDVARLTSSHQVMLDFVVNHLDIDNDALNAYRRGEGSGEEFLIISDHEYQTYRADGTLEKTFRPRPFPLFTGMRKFPATSWENGPVAEMKRRIGEQGFTPPDDRVIEFLAIAFKILNDQGLTAVDRRVFSDFISCITADGIDPAKFFDDSPVQPQQKVLSDSVHALMAAIGVDGEIVDHFNKLDDEIFGTKFFVYTTFSESQVDINPVTDAGFTMVIDDLFELLLCGDPAMLRMDAIKYLWKEIGEKNFDMKEGNILIDVIRSVMRIAAPAALPLDEINSPDPVVYSMLNDGGFAYVFGQVNSVPAAFNSGSLEPIKKFRAMMDQSMPEGIVPFVMLSTHDGRSVQGLGVDRTDGHVSFKQFYELIDVVEQRGGKPKYRSVPAGRIPRDTFEKARAEVGLDKDVDDALFEAGPDDSLVLRKEIGGSDEFISRLSEMSGNGTGVLAESPAIQFCCTWLFDGLTPYELCCTSRDAFKENGPDGTPLKPEMEAMRLALAQLYVLTLGQCVPAIYFNDLLGVANDFAGYAASGRPRDLNRKKSALSASGLGGGGDQFAATYIPLINRYIELRSNERAFYPGSQCFEFRALSDVVFLNHAYARDEDVYVIGNISGLPVTVELPVEGPLHDLIGSTEYRSTPDAVREAELSPFGALWLKPSSA